MSRRSGAFPTYEKLDFHPDIWPDYYYESSKQCAKCGFKWPNIREIEDSSPCCGGILVAGDETPSLRWPDMIEFLKKCRFEKFYDEWNEGVEDDQLIWEEMKDQNGDLDQNKVNELLGKLTENNNE